MKKNMTATTDKKSIKSTTAKDKKSPKIKVLKEDDLAIVTGGRNATANIADCI